MWLYVITTAALLAQLAVEQGAALPYAAVMSAAAVGTCARFMSVAAPLGRMSAIAFLSALSFGALAVTLHPPRDPHHVRRLLEDDGRTATAVSLIADVIEPPRQRLQGGTAVVEARGLIRFDGSVEPVRGRVSLSVHHWSGRLRFGERITFRARLARIANFLNPGEFDYARWCARRGIYVSAFAWDDREISTLGPSPDADVVTRLRVAVARAAQTGRGAAGALTAALVVGDASSLQPGLMESIRISGLTHLLAISGMNVGVVAFVALWICRQLLALTPIPASGRDPIRPAAAIAGLAVLGYGALSGGGESVVRATVMALVALGALWRGRTGQTETAVRAMAIAALVLCLLSPGAVAEAGFQLSFIATAAILAFAAPLRALAARPVIGPILLAFAIGVLCWAVTAPILAYDFERISLVAPLAGIVTGLPCAVTVIAGLAGAVLLPVCEGVARWCFDVASWGGAAVVATARLAAQPSWAELRVVNPGAVAASCLALLPLLPALPRPQRARAAAAVLAVLTTAGLHAAHERYRRDCTDIVFASVGQGDATVVRLAGGKVLVVDGGPPGRGRSVLAPLLRRMAVGRIDYLVATHAQDDHWGGLADLADDGGFEIGEFWHPGGDCSQHQFVSFTRRLAAQGTAVHDVGAELALRAREGRAAAIHRHGPGWRVHALWPRDTAGACDDNDRSVVVLLRFGGSRVLLTGDIERAAEQELARVPRRIRASVLKAPHHGSRTSSSALLLAAVRPDAALASSGIANRYGFPHAEVVARYRALGVRLYRTDVDGALRVTAYRDRLFVTPVRGPKQLIAAPARRRNYQRVARRRDAGAHLRDMLQRRVD